MSDVVNLRRARKAKARAKAGAMAAANRAKFGEGKAAKQSANAAQTRIDRTLDDAKREC